MSRAFESNNLAWIDVESTDLDRNIGKPHARLLEIACTITTPHFDVIGMASHVIPIPHDFDWGPVHPRVIEMHTANGLMAEVYRENLPSLEQTEQSLIEFIRRSGAAKSPMCGSSVHTDRNWLRAFTPALEAVFHFRNFDASSLWIMAEANGIQVGSSPIVKAHRGLSDIEQSIDLARVCWHHGGGMPGVQSLARTALQCVPDDADGTRGLLESILR